LTVKNPKCLVIDASIARASGGIEAFDPIPQMCRDFLQETLKCGHSIIITDGLFREWTKHSSKFAWNWYIQMQRKGKIKRHIGSTEYEELRQAIIQFIEQNAITNVLKDMLLLEAALLADKIVASRDERIKGHFSRAARGIEELRPIVWVNPTIQDEECIIWLRENAQADAYRLLGYLVQ